MGACVVEQVDEQVWFPVFERVERGVGARVWANLEHHSWSIGERIWTGVGAYFKADWLTFYHFFATYLADNELHALAHFNELVAGYLLGVLHFATLSTGETIENPHHYRKGLKQLKLLSQAKDRRKKGSHRRKRAAIALAKAHRNVRNQRKDFHHKAACSLVNRFGLIVFEDLNIIHMSKAPEPKPDPDKEGAYLPNGASVKAGLNTSILDAGWGQFQALCVAKAESAGRQVVVVNPRMTSQLCSACGRMVKKDLSERWHSCECGAELDRDHNSATTTLFRGQEVAHRSTGL